VANFRFGKLVFLFNRLLKLPYFIIFSFQHFS